MSEQNTIPTEMLDAVAKAIRDYQRRLEFADDFNDSSAAEAALRAAGVPALRERIAELEAELGEANLIAEARSVVGMDLLAEADQQEARIAELEAANIKLRAEIEVLETENAALEDELSEYPE